MKNEKRKRGVGWRGTEFGEGEGEWKREKSEERKGRGVKGRSGREEEEAEKDHKGDHTVSENPTSSSLVSNVFQPV